ncbi:YcnI family protein [Cellulomonas sp. URHE0023]|uniref:YcnI family protein n=1 Tax=Cellulomonas sp. URHE0023 TaxID=1380354 RepID=UPI00048039B5|nr:YcnI family protein [Cellulomonas sp. URHE0023]
MSSIHRRARVASIAVTGLALVVLPAAAASAHVHIDPDETTAGGFTVLTVRVPNESVAAATSKVVVDLPTDTPLLSVSTRPVPGWTASVATAPLPEPVDFYGTTLTEAPATVTWTAEPGNEIADGQFQQFEISVGPLPEAGTELVLPTHQTYTDGTVVDWADATPPSGEEPGHPAPAFTTTAAETQGQSHPTEPSSGSAGAETSDPVARVFGLAGVLLGAGALVVALVSARRRRVDA